MENTSSIEELKKEISWGEAKKKKKKPGKCTVWRDEKWKKIWGDEEAQEAEKEEKGWMNKKR